jgi:hypothetical protein
MSGNHTSTTNHNKDILVYDLKLTQINNSSLFVDKDIFVFSPAVSKNSQNYYWFDIREINIERMHNLKPKLCIVLIRIVPNIFVVCQYIDIQKLFTNPKTEQNGKKAWEFIIEDCFSKIKNRHSAKYINVHPLDKMELLVKFSELRSKV